MAAPRLSYGCHLAAASCLASRPELSQLSGCPAPAGALPAAGPQAALRAGRMAFLLLFWFLPQVLFWRLNIPA